MVKTQRARMPHVVPKRGNKGRIGCFAQTIGHEWRQPPILTELIVQFRGSTYTHTDGVKHLISLGFCSTAIDRIAKSSIPPIKLNDRHLWQQAANQLAIAGNKR